MNNPLINRSRVKELALQIALDKGKIVYGGKPRYTRVSSQFLDRIESRLYAIITKEVEANLSGHTLK